MAPGEHYRFGPFHIDVAERELRRQGELVPLTAKTFDLLLILVRGAGRTFQKSELIECLWPGTIVEENNLSQTIFLLRKALGENGDDSPYILTAPRRGYKFIGKVSREPVAADGAPSGITALARPSRFWPAIAGLAILVFLGLASVYFRGPAPEARVVYSTILFPQKTSVPFMALSPDGRHLAFVGRGEDGKSQLWIRPLNAPAAQPLPGTEGVTFAFWSPDSRWLAFYADAKLKKIDTQGGPPITLAEAPFWFGGSWNASGTIVFAPDYGALKKISASGGTATPVTTVNAAVGFAPHSLPSFLPDGEHFLFTTEKGTSLGGRMNLVVGSVNSPATKIIGEVDSNAVYSEGRLLYLRESILVAQPFDVKALRFTGEAVPVAERVSHLGLMGVFSVSAAGLLAYETGPAAGGQQLTWFNRTGTPVTRIGKPQSVADIELSPDRKRLAVSTPDAAGNVDLWIYDLARGLPTRFTFDPAEEYRAVWSPDGRTIVFNSRRGAHFNLYRKSADGAGAEELLYADDHEKYPISWSPDGRYLLYDTGGGGPHSYDLFLLPLTPDRPGAPLQTKPFLQTKFAEWFGQFSPDGQWVAYESDESQQAEIYVAPFLRPTEKRQVSSNGGARPRWRKDGKEIFYVTAEGRLMGAEVEARGGSLEVGRARELFGGIPIPITTPGYLYDVSADGQQILVAAPVTNDKSPEPMTLVQNWTSVLRK